MAPLGCAGRALPQELAVPSASKGPLMRLCWDGGRAAGVAKSGCEVVGLLKVKGASCAFSRPPRPFFSRRQVQSLIPNSFPWEHWEECL